ncbi:MAG: DUF2934 domain-containing protein [Chromatiaceae bacterium]|jgi:hypothetical protein
MKRDCEEDDWTPGLRSKLFFRAVAEATWLRGSVLGHGGHADSMYAPANARERRIREAAYFKAEQRGFAPGYELDDWLEAEAELGT